MEEQLLDDVIRSITQQQNAANGKENPARLSFETVVDVGPVELPDSIFGFDELHASCYLLELTMLPQLLFTGLAALQVLQILGLLVGRKLAVHIAGHQMLEAVTAHRRLRSEGRVPAASVARSARCTSAT